MRKRLLKRSDPLVCMMTLLLAVMAVVMVSEGFAADPTKPGAAVKAADAKAEDAKAVGMKPAPEYRYNPTGKPDPFKPFIEEEITEKQKLEKRKEALPISPLQRAGVEQFRLVGIAGTESSRKAIVQDVNNKFYPIFVGTIIGRNNGKVVEILADRVIVEEAAGTRAGKAVTKKITIKLRKDEGEEKP
ncbi:MAG: pilus assembly protein PilP [Deltaproteobacteria bacterium]|nr:pilus assembly protein PilP [Deltaproteobacteria bacterium]